MHRDAVKHFADDLNQRVDVPEHPSHPGINLIRQGLAPFLGKGDDGLVFDTQDGNVSKVTTSVPFNLAYFREHRHAIADARRQVELNNQALSDGHDLFVPQEFTEHGEKGFTTMPRLQLDQPLSREQIIEFREKMQRFTDDGWRIGDTVQTGVDDQGTIRVFDTGKLSRSEKRPEKGTFDYDPDDQLKHAPSLLRKHNHYDDEKNDFEMRLGLQELTWALTDEEYHKYIPKQTEKIKSILQDMISNDHDALPFVIDDVREALAKAPGQSSKKAGQFELHPDGRLIGYRVSRAKDGEAVSGADSRVGTSTELGSNITMPGIGMFVTHDPEYAARYYGSHDKNVIVKLAFDQSEITGGNIGDAETEISVKNAEVLDSEIFEDEQSPRMANVQPRHPGVEEIESIIDGYESREVNSLLDSRLIDAQKTFSELVDDYEGIEPGEEPHGESLDTQISNTELFEKMVPGLTGEQLAVLGFKAYESYGDEINLAGFSLDGDVLHGMSDQARALRTIAEVQEGMGINLQGEPLLPGQITGISGKYEPEKQPDIDEFMRNQYPVTYEFGPAGFIMANGEMLDMSGDGGMHRGEDHRAIIPSDEAALRWDWGTDEQGFDGFESSRWYRLNKTLQAANAIRFDATGLMHMEAEPTQAQLETVSRFLREERPDNLHVRFGKGENDAIAEWHIENPSPGDLLRTLERVQSGMDPYPPTEFQQLPKDEWPDYHQNLIDSGDGSYGYISVDEYLSVIPEQALHDLKNVITQEVEDKEYAMDRGEMFPPLLFWPMAGSQNVAVALAARNLGIDQVPVLTDSTATAPEFEAPSTDQFREFWGNSVVVDEEGKPKAQMHGTTTDADISMFETMRGRDFGSHFGNVQQSSDFLTAGQSKNDTQEYRDNARIYPVWLSIQNPLITDDLGRWDVDEITAFMEEKLEEKGIPWPSFISDDEVPDRSDWNDEVMDLVPEVTNEHAWFNNYMGAWEKFKQRKNWEMLRDAMEDAGYDGIAYQNVYEGDGAEMSYVALRPSQIKSVLGNTGKFDRGDNRVNYAASDDAEWTTGETVKRGPEKPKALPLTTNSGSNQQMLPKSQHTRNTDAKEKTTQATDAIIQPEHLELYEHVEPKKVEPRKGDPKALQNLADQFYKFSPASKAHDNLMEQKHRDNIASGMKGYMSKEVYSEQTLAAYVEQVKEKRARQAFNTVMSAKWEDDQDEELQREHLHNSINTMNAFPDGNEPEDTSKVPGYENDDYYYHITDADNVEAINREGLRTNQGDSDKGTPGYEWSRRREPGTVYLTEKEHLPLHLKHHSQNSYHKLQSRVEDLQRQIIDLESQGNKDDGKLYDAREELNLLASKEAALAKDPNALVRTLRIPKNLISDVVAEDQKGELDTAPSLALDRFAAKQVRWAKQQAGKTQKQVSDAGAEQKTLGKERKLILDTLSEGKRYRSELRREFNEDWNEYFDYKRQIAVATSGREFRATNNEASQGPLTPIILEVRDTTRGDTESAWNPVYRGWFDTRRDPDQLPQDDWQSKTNEQLSAEMFADFQDHAKALFGMTEWEKDMLPNGELLATPSNQPYAQDVPREKHIHNTPNALTINDYYANPGEAFDKYLVSSLTDVDGMKSLHTIKTYLDHMMKADDQGPVGSMTTIGDKSVPAWLAGKPKAIQLMMGGLVGKNAVNLEVSGNAGQHIQMMKGLFEQLDNRGASFGNKFEKWADSELAIGDVENQLSDWDAKMGDRYQAALTTMAKGQIRNLQLSVASQPGYWRWAKNNRAVDSEGLPLIIFHGSTSSGFLQFGRLDVDGHIYGSTNATTGATYTGGFYDDTTPIFATDIEDIENTIRSNDSLNLEVNTREVPSTGEIESKYTVYQYPDYGANFKGRPVIGADTEEELLVKWNAYVSENDGLQRGRGVYPLVYRLENPLVVEGGGANWNKIPMFGSEFDQRDDGSAYSLVNNNMFMALVNNEWNKHGYTALGQLYDTAKKELGMAAPGTEQHDAYTRGYNALKSYSEKVPVYEWSDKRHIVQACNEYYEAVMQEEWLTPEEASGFSTSSILKQAFQVQTNKTGTTRTLATLAEAAGHDGIVFKDIKDHGGQDGSKIPWETLEPSDVYVCFTKEQCKSAHNVGTFRQVSDKEKLLYSATA